MIQTNAIFSRKENTFETHDCIVEKIIRLSGAEYDSFAHNMLQEQKFIKDNIDLMRYDSDGRQHCLLVVGEDRRDGILVDSSGSDYARYSAFIPNVEGLLTVGQYPALAELNKKLSDITNYIAEQSAERVAIGLEDIETRFNINLEFNDVLFDTVFNMLGERPEIQAVEMDNNELIIYGNQEIGQPAEDLSEPSITKTDMYAYGYTWDGMTPIGKEEALKLFDEGIPVFRLYHDGAEGMADSREGIEEFAGMFGIESAEWTEPAQSTAIEVFIVNRERQEKGENIGEWLTLPADAETLRGLLERVGVDRPSEGAFAVTAVRVSYEWIKDYVSKYDSLDELNMLASYMSGMEDYEIEKLQAILTSGVTDIGRGTAALINLLDENNFSAVELIDAKNAYELGEYYILDVPYKMSFSEYGNKLAREEGGVFTGAGYLYNKYEQEPEYTGVVPDEYKIVDKAIQDLHPKTPARDRLDEKLSVIEQIRASRQAQREPKESQSQNHKKDKGGQEH